MYAVLDGIASYVTASEYSNPGRYWNCYRYMAELTFEKQRDKVGYGRVQVGSLGPACVAPVFSICANLRWGSLGPTGGLWVPPVSHLCSVSVQYLCSILSSN